MFISALCLRNKQIYKSMDQSERIKELEAQVLMLTKAKDPSIVVSKKGCVQINGIRRFPFTFYKKELEIILNMTDKLKQFAEENDSKLV